MFYIALSIISLYLAYIFIRYRQIPISISDTFYLGANWLFTAVMWIIGFTTAASLINITPETYQFLPFLIGAGLLFVGAAPQFKENFVSKVHYGGALVFALAVNAWASIYCSPWVLLTWLSALLWFKTKQRTFWAEIVCIINILIAYVVS